MIYLINDTPYSEELFWHKFKDAVASKKSPTVKLVQKLKADGEMKVGNDFYKIVTDCDPEMIKAVEVETSVGIILLDIKQINIAEIHLIEGTDKEPRHVEVIFTNAKRAFYYKITSLIYQPL